MSVSVIERLNWFNRKERDHLAKLAYCGSSRLELSAKFRSDLESVLGPASIKIPEDDGVFFGMDYHLNWLFCAIWASHKLPDENSAYENPQGYWRLPKRRKKKDEKTVVVHDTVRLLEQNQEDVDFIVAFHQPSDNRLKVILIEAKLDTGWDSVQFARKVGRIDNISRACKQAGFDPCIDWSIVLLSPTRPTKEQLKLPVKAKEPNDFSNNRLPDWVFRDGNNVDSIPHLMFNPPSPAENNGRKTVKRLGRSEPAIGYWEIEN